MVISMSSVLTGRGDDRTPDFTWRKRRRRIGPGLWMTIGVVSYWMLRSIIMDSGNLPPGALPRGVAIGLQQMKLGDPYRPIKDVILEIDRIPIRRIIRLARFLDSARGQDYRRS